MSLLIHFILAEGEPGRYFVGNAMGRSDVSGEGAKGASGTAWRDVWLGGGVLTEGLSGFVLGWAGVGGVIR